MAGRPENKKVYLYLYLLQRMSLIMTLENLMFDNGSFVSGLPENAVQPVTKVNDSPERGDSWC